MTLGDIDSDKLLRSLEGHSKPVNSVAYDPTGRTLASASSDHTVKLWDVISGHLLRSLEGHSSDVNSVAFSHDGRLLASKGGLDDNTVCSWHSDTGAILAKIPEPASGSWPPGLAFHPSLPLLATVGSAPGTSKDEADRIIHIWELDFDLLLGQIRTPAVTYTSAKVVLVGESGVGKSSLALRIAEDRAPNPDEIKSTHGMKFWPIEPERLSSDAASPEGQRRDVVLWDLGGQDEYRLVHQLFLHDTTLALVLFDPTRGRTAFEEVEAWNKRLEKQLRSRPAVKLLVGAKLDQACDTIDRQGLEQLRQACGFAAYHETSALNGRGLPELCHAMSRAIDWEHLAKTSRPELFQRIRDEIDARRRSGQIVLHVADLLRSLNGEAGARRESEGEEGQAVNAVTEQLATQGVIARSRVSTGEPVLVLRVDVVDRYANSLVVAARNNPRGVPALELRALALPDFSLPGIPRQDRLERDQERAVLECTVQLLLEHGICFQHEGLLIFPSLFVPVAEAPDEKLPHAVSLYYDFSGAIDNIYASLVSWLVLAQDFGRVRLSANGAAFELGNGGLCGLRKVQRPGGFAHVDVYFEDETPPARRDEFISFVEDHLRQHDVEIREHVALKCPCGEQLEEETVRKRIARGDKDVVCPVCERRHSLVEGAAESRRLDPALVQRTWALKTAIEKRRQERAEQAVQVLERPVSAPDSRPIRLLHLSDLHFEADTSIPARLEPLIADIRGGGDGLGCEEVDYLVISGDFTSKGHPAGFERAYDFVSELVKTLGLSAERCVFVPGNHDTVDKEDAYERRKSSEGLRPGEWVQEGRVILARDPEKYPLRFKPFSDGFFHKFFQRAYPMPPADQGLVIPFWETGLQFLALNSCWEIDDLHRKRSGIHPDAVAKALKLAREQEADARASGQLEADAPLLRIGVWHHAVNGPEQMKNTDFLDQLRNAGVRICLHGDLHEARRELVGHWLPNKMHVIGAGSFGAPAADRPESTPRLYNLLEISRDLKSVRVRTRCQPRPDGPWKGWNEWPHPTDDGAAVPYYDIEW